MMSPVLKAASIHVSYTLRFAHTLLILVLAIFPLCTVEADLSKVPKGLFETATNSKGKQYYKISFELEMTFKSASIFFELGFEGISYGSVRAKYYLSLRSL